MRTWIAVGLSAGLALPAFAKSPPPHGDTARAIPSMPPSKLPVPRIWTRPAPPLPMLPSVSRVRVEAARDRVVVIEDIQLPRGEWQSGGLDLYVAFGAPGTPIAVDARMVSQHASESHPEAGDEVSVEPAVRRNAGAQPLLGKPQMAGVVVHVREAQLRQAYDEVDAAVLRIRSLLSPPAADASGARDVVVRLGTVAGQPLTVGRIQLVSLEPQPWIERAEASLCGPEADPWPLLLSLSPAPAKTTKRPAAAAIAPAMAARHPSDDLCIRWWAP